MTDYEGEPWPDSGVSHESSLELRAVAIAVVLAVGAFAVVLAVAESSLFELDRFAVPKELALSSCALLALLLMVRRGHRFELTTVETALILFGVWSAISALFATNRWIALRSFGLTFSGVIIFMAAQRILRTGDPFDISGTKPRRLRDHALAALAVAAVLGALIGAGQAYGLDLPWLAEERAPGGTFGNRNFLAHLTAIAIPLISIRAIRARHSAGRTLWLVALAICANAIVLTRSRAGWLGLAAALAVACVALFFTRRVVFGTNGIRRRLLFVPAALATGAVAAVLLPNTLDWRSDSPYVETLSRLTDYRGGSGRGRLIQYENTLKLVAADPVLGTGPGNWLVMYPLVTTPGDPSYAGVELIPTNPWPSSDWFALVAERGTVGLLLVLLAGGAVTLVAARRLRSDDIDEALRSMAALGVLAAAAVTGAFDAVLLNAAPTFFVAALCGLLLPVTHPVLSMPTRGRRRLVASVGLVLIAGVIVMRSGQQLAAIRITRDDQSRAALLRAVAIDPFNHRLHLILSRRGPCSARIEHARSAARLLPHHPAPRRALSSCGASPG